MKLCLLFTVLLSFALMSCVSVNLGGGKSERAEDVEFVSPADPFEDEELPQVDEGWKNPQNGNSISFISDCGGGQDPTLEALRTGVLSTLRDVEILSEDKAKYNGRAALRSEVKGNVDGVESQLDLMIFKKNNCIYILTYVAHPDSFVADHPQFNRFLQGFRAP